MPARKPLKVPHTASPSLPLADHPLFPLADRYAAQILAASVLNTHEGVEETDDALYALFKKTAYYRGAQKDKHLDAKGFLVDVDGAGALMNGCWEAGLLLGVAFGLRLRGAA